MISGTWDPEPLKWDLGPETTPNHSSGMWDPYFISLEIVTFLPHTHYCFTTGPLCKT